MGLPEQASALCLVAQLHQHLPPSLLLRWLQQTQSAQAEAGPRPQQRQQNPQPPPLLLLLLKLPLPLPPAAHYRLAAAGYCQLQQLPQVHRPLLLQPPLPTPLQLFV